MQAAMNHLISDVLNNECVKAQAYRTLSLPLLLGRLGRA